MGEHRLNSQETAREHFNAGNQYALIGEYDPAITEYKKAIALDPDNANTYENLAISYAKKADFSKAIKVMEKGILLSPEDAVKYSTLGVIYHASNQLQSALEQYKKSIRLNPGYGEMYYNIALIYKDLKQLEPAYLSCLQAQSLGFPGSSQLLLDLLKDRKNLAKIVEKKNKSYHLRHIVTSEADKANLALGKLREAEDFNKLASELSLQPYNMNGGYIGPFSPDSLMLEIAEKIVPLAPFAYSSVLETSSGFHVFQKFTVFDDLLL